MGKQNNNGGDRSTLTNLNNDGLMPFPPGMGGGGTSGESTFAEDQTSLTPQIMPRPATMPNPRQEEAAGWEGFRVGSQDQHGHSERIWVRIQPGHARQMSTIVNLHAFPYRDQGDLLRHALDRHLKFLQGLTPMPSVTKQVDVILEILREEEFQADFRTVFDKLTKQVQHYVQLGADNEARGLVGRIRQNIEDMPAGPWRRRYLEELNEKYGYLIRNARGINLARFDNGDDD